MLDWVPRISPQFERPYHLAPIARELERIDSEGTVRLLISAPPRFGKSQLLTHFVSWYLARNPGHSLAYASYASGLSKKQSKFAREYAIAAGLELSDEFTSLSRWETVQGGGLLATSVGGTFTGLGANVLIIDDSVANREEAESAVMRDKVFDWATSTAFTRLESVRGSIVICQTRWHERDLIGRLLAEQPGVWTYINLPALDEAGESLWPEQWSADALRHKRALVGSWDWNSLYMGRPKPRGGALFRGDPVRYEHPEIAGRRIVLACDPAATDGNRSDYSVAIALAVTGAGADLKADVLDVIRGRWQVPQLVKQLAQFQKKWNASLAIESHGVGKAVPQFMRQMENQLRIVEVHVSGDKALRASPVADAWAEGRVRVPMEAPWLRDFLTEVLSFTGNDAHDDQVDALSLAWNRAAKSSGVSVLNVPKGPFARPTPRGDLDEWGLPKVRSTEQ